MVKDIYKRLKRKSFLVITGIIGSLLSKLFTPAVHVKISLIPNNYRYLKQSKNKRLTKSNWAIVIQGPILNSKHLKYLLNNLHVLRDNFPKARLVISSYEQYKNLIANIPNSLFDELILLDENKFVSNFERQVASTHYGINAAEKYKISFILKLRTDQMIYHPSALNIFEEMFKTYKSANGKGKNSLIASSYNSWLYRPFGVSEMLMAGTFDDMRKYWEYDDQIKNYKLEYKKPPGWLTQNNFYYESFLAVKYLIKSDFKFTNDIFKDSVAMYKKHFIIVDSSTINQNWFKRNPVWSGNSVVKSGYNLPPNSLIEISHADWLAFRLGSHTLRPDKLAARH